MATNPHRTKNTRRLLTEQMRVTRESSWGKLINKQVTRWVGSRQIDMRAHGTQKTRTEATCSHKTKTQAHGQQTIHQPCAKQDTNTQLLRKLISHVSTQDMTTWMHATNELHKLRATQHKITWMHAANKNTNYVQHNKTHVDRRARSRANSRPRTHTMTESRERVSEPRQETETQDMSAGIRTPRSNAKQGTQTSARLEHTQSRALTWKQDMTGVSGLCHKTMNNPRQNPDSMLVYRIISQLP